MTALITSNFGLLGQPETGYDQFLCGKRCRKRKAEKRKLRTEKKQLKNDARRAENERVRAETNLLNMESAPAASMQVKPKILAGDPISGTPKSSPESAPRSRVRDNAKHQQTSVLLIAGVLILGAIVIFKKID